MCKEQTESEERQTPTRWKDCAQMAHERRRASDAPRPAAIPTIQPWEGEGAEEGPPRQPPTAKLSRVSVEAQNRNSRGPNGEWSTVQRRSGISCGPTSSRHYEGSKEGRPPNNDARVGGRDRRRRQEGGQRERAEREVTQ